jgi:DNA-binding winged helix-turn-helix (wHTH) protein
MKALAPKPFAVLCALARANGRLVTKMALRDLIWGHRFVTDAVLKSAISEVRAALDDDPKQPLHRNGWRHGYRYRFSGAHQPCFSLIKLETLKAQPRDA